MKILEVSRKEDGSISFETDVDPVANPDVIHDLVVEAAMAMMTTLWGGKESAVLAMIRVLSIADLGVSVNRKQMVQFLDEASATLTESLEDARRSFVASGGKVVVYAPGEPRPDLQN